MGELEVDVHLSTWNRSMDGGGIRDRLKCCVEDAA